MKNVEYKCPHCGSKHVDFSQHGGDEENGFLYYKGLCLDCGKEIVATYQLIGYLSEKDFNAIMGNYEVSVRIYGISVDDYIRNYDNEETRNIMSSYVNYAEEVEKSRECNTAYDAYFSLKFKDFEDALSVFKYHADFHESENGDAMNIVKIHDVRKHGDVLKQEIIYCNDYHNIVITLKELREMC